ncbi:MAG: DnaJ C-terminal domain-containing protein [Pseudorhodobacter sp.]|nr:DnaJ C-terminal domain-containing protein [Pseudorhodobacter sp.]
MSRDPYAVLGVAKAATAAQIKAAYRKLVRASHPDLNPDDAGAEARFKAASAAYDLLKDPATRARFDAGEIDASGAERPDRKFYRDYAESPQHPYQQARGFQGQGDPGDIFAEFLRQRGQGGAGPGGEGFARGDFAARGPDLHFALEVPFLDAVRGAKTRITLPGGGNLEVQIPPGTAPGQILRLRGHGGPGHGGGPAGDALIEISLRPHPVFRRDGDDIVITLPITLDEAILGGKVTTPTIKGPVSLTIPKGASSGRVLRLRGRGVPRAAGGTGDQRVELRIVLPNHIDPELHAFFETRRNTHPDDPRSALFEGMPT